MLGVAPRLGTTSYAVLSLLATRPMSAYAVARQYPRSMRWSWPLSQAHLYSEPKRLAAAGLVRVKRVPAGPLRTRQEFHITPKGRRALARWMATPPGAPELNHELMLRVGFADNGTVADLHAALDAAESKLAQLYADGIEQVEGYLADGGPFPERMHLIALASDFNARFLELCHDWIDDVRAEATEWSTTVGLGPTERTRRRLVAILRRARTVRWRTEAKATAPA
jgi:DNA-binding PadR family transcriptional regulator